MFRTIRDIDFTDKTVLVKVDFNVPLDSNLQITDDTRIRKTIPTLKNIINKQGRLVVMSHLGRPKGERNEKYSLKPLVSRLSDLLETPVKFSSDCIGAVAKQVVSSLKNGEVALLENLRFHKGEEKNDPEFAAELASLGDIFVSDAFGTAHRAHASSVGIADVLPAYAGLLMEKEIQYLDKVTVSPQHPFVAIMGGAKVSDKILLIENLMQKVDALLIGGGMAFTFLKAQGHEIGKSLCEEENIPLAKRLLEQAASSSRKIILPLDVVVAPSIKSGTEAKVVSVDLIPPDQYGLDIGPQTVKLFENELKVAKTVLWNGPMGVFETSPFDEGTRGVAEILTRLDATTVVGGGDSVAALEQMDSTDKVSHVSTGGGACLEYLEGKLLPGIEIFSRDIKQMAGGKS